MSDYEVLQLAQWACQIEKHYSEIAGRPTPMDLEWVQTTQLILEVETLTPAVNTFALNMTAANSRDI